MDCHPLNWPASGDLMPGLEGRRTIEECALPRLLKKEVVVEEEKVDMEETKEKQVVKVWELRLAVQPILRRKAFIMMSTCPLHSLSHAFRHSPTSACHSSTRQNCIFTYPHQLARCQMPDARSAFLLICTSWPDALEPFGCCAGHANPEAP